MPMMSSPRQPIVADETMQAVRQVNDDHLEQLLYCVQIFTPRRDARDARVVAVYVDGVDVEALGADGTWERQFIPFLSSVDVAASLPEHITALALQAMRELGVWPPRRVHTWLVTENRSLSPHFQRITFDLGGDVRADWQAGYSCRFVLGTDAEGERSRPYTLRRVVDGLATVDVYCHEDSPGSRWTQGLALGDAVTVKGGRQEVFPDFELGPVLLLGDETALPTIAALLDGWPDEQPVHVLLNVADEAERGYLAEMRLPSQAHIHRLAHGENLLERIETLPFQAAAVWGALEVGQARALKRHLKARFPAADVKVIGYWIKT